MAHVHTFQAGANASAAGFSVFNAANSLAAVRWDAANPTTRYMVGSVVGSTCTYTLTDGSELPADAVIGTVVLYTTFAAQTDGVRTPRIKALVNGVVTGGFLASPATTSMATNPATAAAWTRAELFTSTFGIQIIDQTVGGVPIQDLRYYQIRVAVSYTSATMTSSPATLGLGGGLVTLSFPAGRGDFVQPTGVVGVNGVGTFVIDPSVAYVAAADTTVASPASLVYLSPAASAGTYAIACQTLEAETTVAGLYHTHSFSVDYAASWWKHTYEDEPTGFTFEAYQQAAVDPDTAVDPDITVDWSLFGADAPALVWWKYATYNWWAYQVNSPGTGWVLDSAPANDGWYISPEGFGGSIVIAANGRPKDPRSWVDISTWATAGTAMLGGSPAASCVFDNHMLYPGTDYTVGTDYPPIRVFDGSFDRELCTLPPTTSNGVPRAVISMLAANQKIYLTSFDSGTTSADWRGRVFELDLASGVLTALGTNFAAGEMPYALCWHMGRLWCGTNNGIGTVGKVYYFRPGIDTTWTLDHSLATETVGGVDSLASYQGKLYVGSDNAAAAFAKVLVRDSAGAYTVSETATGGTATVNNGYLAMAVFGDNLYASYWNRDTPAVAKIRKFDGATWTTAYTGASTTLRPFILLQEDNDELFAIAGGCALSGAILRTPDGTTWTNLTTQLFESSKTLLPIFGVEIQ